MPFKFVLRTFRERINIKLYASKTIVLSLLRILRLVVSLGMVGAMVYFHGFKQDLASQEVHISLIRSSFIFYVLSYLLRFVYDFEPRKFIRTNAIEGIMVAILALELVVSITIGRSFFESIFIQLGATEWSSIFSIFIQVMLLAIVMIELGKASQRLTLLDISPSSLFIISFVVLIFGGGGLLMLPEMTTSGESMPFIDALFTSTSASCVTGLIVVDTATYFSFKGQLLILLLIQLGGLNIISFASFFATFMQKGVGLRHHLMIKDFMSYDTLSSTSELLKRVILFSFLIELLGAVLIFMTWDPSLEFKSMSQKIFYSVFHSISAFNNAGFSTYSGGLFEPIVRDSYILHIVVAGLVFLGGLGIPILNDMFSPTNMRNRLTHPWKRLQISSRLSLYTSIILIVVGAILFHLLESQNPYQWADGGYQTQNYFGQAVTSIFQSVITRTAGFNTTDIGLISTPVILLFILLMFIGASSGGTGGGIKTSTFAVIFLSALATIRGKKYVEIYRQTIGQELLYKAFSIFLFSLSVVFVGTFLLSITDPHVDVIRLAFEEVSAFATVGLSTNLTAQLSVGSKIILMVTMLIGRVGVLTIAFAISRKVISNNYKYPDAYIMLG